jgi:uncharacterized protein (DUF302 family)
MPPLSFTEEQMMQKSWCVLFSCLLQVVTVQAAEMQTDDTIFSPAVLMMESPYSFEGTVSNLRDAIGAGNFRMIREQPWDYGLENGVTNSRETILYFCNFDMVDRAIKLDRRVGQLLPFRITIVEQGDRVWAVAINPEAVMQIKDSPRLGGFRERVASMYRQILEEGLL